MTVFIRSISGGASDDSCPRIHLHRIRRHIRLLQRVFLQQVSLIQLVLHNNHHNIKVICTFINGTEVEQKGSNITAERLRFDFSFDRKMSEKEIKQVEDWVNEAIQKKLPIKYPVSFLFC